MKLTVCKTVELDADFHAGNPRNEPIKSARGGN